MRRNTLQRCVAYLLARGYRIVRIERRGSQWGWCISDEDGDVCKGRGGVRQIRKWVKFLVAVEQGGRQWR